MIDKLVNASGNFRDILGLPADGPVDLSTMDWGELCAVVRSIEFDNARISGTEVSPDFVECDFRHCTFEEIIAEGHFSGAGNRWDHCRFRNCKFKDLLAPQSRFANCTFEGVDIVGITLCQTVFTDCRFKYVSIRALETRRIGDRARQLPETAAKGATGLFRNCRFEHVAFTACKLHYVCFEGCHVEATRFDHCSLENVISRDPWLEQVQPGDPFTAFLDEAILKIRNTIGGDCESVRALESYKDDYVMKRTTSKNYSAVLYDGRVSDDELDVVSDLLDDIEPRYAF